MEQLGGISKHWTLHHCRWYIGQGAGGGIKTDGSGAVAWVNNSGQTIKRRDLMIYLMQKDGTNGQVLKTDGGNSWTANGSGSVIILSPFNTNNIGIRSNKREH